MQQFASPQTIKEAPANLFTGTFVGEPPMNVFAASAREDDGRLTLALAGGVELAFDGNTFAPRVRAAILARPKIVLGVRPHAVRRSDDGAEAVVVANQWLGDQSQVAASFAGGTVVLVEHDRTGLAVGDRIKVRLQPQDLHIFDSETGVAISHGVQLA